MDKTIVVQTASEEETRALGAAMGEAAEAGDVILLQGSFGAGKTTFVQGLARGLGIGDQVTSPSFVIACEYQGRLPLYHIDLWRVEQMDSATLEALAEYFGGDGVCTVEWPDAVPTDLIADAVRIRIVTVGENARALSLDEGSSHYRDAFGAFARRSVADPPAAAKQRSAARKRETQGRPESGTQARGT